MFLTPEQGWGEGEGAKRGEPIFPKKIGGGVTLEYAMSQSCFKTKRSSKRSTQKIDAKLTF